MTIAENNFWSDDNMQQGDSIFIEGSFEVPTANSKRTGWKQNDVIDGSKGTGDYEVIGSANLPIIVQFVHSSVFTYKFD